MDDFAAHFGSCSGRFLTATAEVGEFGLPFLADACAKACSDLGDVVTEAVPDTNSSVPLLLNEQHVITVKALSQ